MHTRSFVRSALAAPAAQVNCADAGRLPPAAASRLLSESLASRARASRRRGPAASTLSESPVSPRLAAVRRRRGSAQARNAAHERALEASARAREAAAAAISRNKGPRNCRSRKSSRNKPQ